MCVGCVQVGGVVGWRAKKKCTPRGPRPRRVPLSSRPTASFARYAVATSPKDGKVRTSRVMAARAARAAGSSMAVASGWGMKGANWGGVAAAVHARLLRAWCIGAGTPTKRPLGRRARGSITSTAKIKEKAEAHAAG